MKSPSVAPLFTIWYTPLCKIARAHGYCLAVHGSMNSDFDLLCVPWVEDPKPEHELVLAMVKAFHNGSLVEPSPEWKPHGRKAYGINYFGEGVLDVSFMPKVRPSVAALTLAQDPLVSLLHDVQNGDISCMKAAQEIITRIKEESQ